GSGRDGCPDGRRDGSTGGRQYGRADRLRHGEGDRLRDVRPGRAPRREDEGAVVNAAVLTVSDGVYDGTREDASGDTLAELLADEGFDVARRVVPDDDAEIEQALRELAAGARLVLTTGG